MPKKGSSVTTPLVKEEKPITDQKKPTPKHEKQGNEIDKIFSTKKKRKKPEKEQIEKQKEDVINIKPKKTKKKSKIPEEDGFVDPPFQTRKRTQDGFAIYTEDELGIGKFDAGDTPDCPFDCSCCF